MTTPKQLADRLDRQIARLPDRIADAQEATTDRLLRYRRQIVHVDTGQLQRDLAAFGPYPVGSGILESRITATVPQGIYEERRGGEHASAARTIAEQQAEIDRLRRELERLTVAAVEGA
jgi:hypothetical protein